MQAKPRSILQATGMSRRNALKAFAIGSAVLTIPTLKAKEKFADCINTRA